MNEEEWMKALLRGTGTTGDPYIQVSLSDIFGGVYTDDIFKPQ